MSSVEWECGYCGKMIDPEKICAQDAAPPQADAEALLRELIEACASYDEVGHIGRYERALTAARAYLAAKDAP